MFWALFFSFYSQIVLQQCLSYLIHRSLFIPDQYQWILLSPLWSHLCYEPALWFFSWTLSPTCFLVTCFIPSSTLHNLGLYLFLYWRLHWQSLKTYPGSGAVATQFWQWYLHQYKVWRRDRVMVILCDGEWQFLDKIDKQSISTLDYSSTPLSIFFVSVTHAQPLSTLTLDIVSSCLPTTKKMSFLRTGGLKILKVGYLSKLHLSKNILHNLRMGHLQKSQDILELGENYLDK